MQDARRLAERAVELDPGFADGYAVLGGTFLQGFALGFDPDAAAVDRAVALEERALELDPDSPTAHVMLSTALSFRGDSARSLSLARRAAELAPNLAGARGGLGLRLLAAGQYLEAMTEFRAARRLNAGRTGLVTWALAMLNLRAGRTDEAIAQWEEVRGQNAENIPARVCLAAVYKQTGREAEARERIAEVRRISPDFDTDWAMMFLRIFNWPGDREALAADLRELGLP